MLSNESREVSEGEEVGTGELELCIRVGSLTVSVDVGEGLAHGKTLPPPNERKISYRDRALIEVKIS
jgi:hypothetical protein